MLINLDLVLLANNTNLNIDFIKINMFNYNIDLINLLFIKVNMFNWKAIKYNLEIKADRSTLKI